MRVAVVHSFYGSQEPSGENIAVEAQAARLAEAGHDVRVVSRRTDDERRRAGYTARAGISALSGYGPSPVGELLDHRPDITHVHNLFPNYGDHWLRMWRGPVVQTIHNFRPLCANGMFSRAGTVCTLCPEQGSHNAVKYKCYRGSRLATAPLAVRTSRGLGAYPQLTESDALVLLSERSLQMYRSFGLEHGDVRVIPNFAPGTSQEVTATQRRTQPFVYLGRLTEDKGIAELLRHWPSDEKLVIYGSGPLEELVRLSQSSNVAFGGLLPRDAVLPVLRKTAGLIFSSLGPENSPIVYLEALSAGAPVIAKGGNAVADDIQDGGHGVIFDQWSALSMALKTAVTSSSTLQVAAAERYANVYSPATWLRRIEELYSSLLMDAPR